MISFLSEVWTTADKQLLQVLETKRRTRALCVWDVWTLDWIWEKSINASPCKGKYLKQQEKHLHLESYWSHCQSSMFPSSTLPPRSITQQVSKRVFQIMKKSRGSYSSRLSPSAWTSILLLKLNPQLYRSIYITHEGITTASDCTFALEFLHAKKSIDYLEQLGTKEKELAVSLWM